MAEEPSLDPRRTVDHVLAREAPSTDDVTGAYQAAGAPAAPNPVPPADAPSTTGAYQPDSCTAPYVPAPPAGAPSIPGYRITAEIARGGMGRIYAGHDLSLDREVAIKTLLPAADAGRFVTEAKITARLPHPGIPPVHALGTLADGTPYLAMKLIRGRTLAELLKERPSPLSELPRFVQIFEQIAQAVGFAHTQGIIHRDLKPLNVMVGAFGEVQVMDWGLAKDVAGDERESELPADDDVTHTAAGSVMGTPGYMAPEQARGEAVDARADVFALGAMLAAILTSQPAFVGRTTSEVIERAARADLFDVQERLANSGADGELIVLALSCLSADVAQRPADGRTVAALVAAYRAGVAARLKQAETERAEAVVREAEQRKRRRTVQVAGGVIAVVLLAGLSVSLWQMFRANAEKHKALQAAEAERQAKEREGERAEGERKAKLEADEKRTEAERNLALAERNLAFAKKGNEILGSVFAGLDPKANYATVADLSNALRDNLNKAVKDLEGSAIGEPLEVAAMQDTLGKALLGLGQASLAVEVLQKALATFQAKLGPDHHDTLASMNNLAAAYQDSGQLAKAVPLFEETLEKTKAKLGPDHLDTLETMNNLAGAYADSGQLAKAVPLYEETLEKRKAKLGADHPNTLISMNNLASAYWGLKRLDRSIPLFEEALKRAEKQLGRRHPYTLQTLANLGVNYKDAGRLGEAIPLLEEALEKRKATLGPNHPDTLSSMNNLAAAYQASGQLAKAVPLYEETLVKQKATLGSDHPDTLTTMNNLAVAYFVSGQVAKVVPLLEETLEKKKAKLGPDHPETLRGLTNLARAYQAALQQHKAKLGAAHPETLGTMANLGLVLLQQKKWAEAEPVLRDCLAISEKQIPDSWLPFHTQSLLGGALLGQKKYAAAEPQLLKGYEGMKTREKTIPKQGGGELRIPEALDRLIELYTAINKPDEAKKWQAERAKYPQGNTKTPEKQ
jgi:serine/threonine protein kinase